LPFSDLPDPFDLNDVVAQSIRRGDERDELYPRLLQILRKAPTKLSPALCSLAGIPTFKLFVSLTFDSQLELAQFLRLEAVEDDRFIQPVEEIGG
jgi:hypothetical protein